MCLIIDDKKTKLEKQKALSNGLAEVTFFKVFCIEDNLKIAPVFQRLSTYDRDTIDDAGL